MQTTIDTLIHISRVIVYIAIYAVLVAIDFTVGVPLLAIVSAALFSSSLHYELQRVAFLLAAIVVFATIFSLPFWVTSLVLGGYVLLDQLYVQRGNRSRWRVVGAVLSLSFLYWHRPLAIQFIHWVYIGIVGVVLVFTLYRRSSQEQYDW